jgi:hypothetical protein
LVKKTQGILGVKVVKQLIASEGRLISRLMFVQIHKLHNFGHSNLHGSIVNVSANIDQTHSLLPYLPKDGTTIGILLKQCLEYETPYIWGNIQSNITMIALKDLIKTFANKECNIYIPPPWNSLRALNMQSWTNLDVDMDIEYNSNVENFEEDIENPPSEILIHNFLDLKKNYYFGNLMSIAPNQECSLMGVFKDKNSEELNYPTLFYGHWWNEKITKNFSYHQVASWEISQES